ncbi:hypothetical protein ABZW47_31240 [Streptomyces sp. NPDC004549]|uniref:hypothetical protein n=1 Tax=Streptomyces sp. NPDC004549 TaxID=3154283 RepID=UPI0033A2173F
MQCTLALDTGARPGVEGRAGAQYLEEDARVVLPGLRAVHGRIVAVTGASDAVG